MKAEKLGLMLGQGFNTITDKLASLAVVGPTIKDDTEHEMEIRLAVIDSQQDLSQLVDASGNVSIPSIEAQMQGNHQINETHHTIHLALFAYTITSKEILKPNYIPALSLRTIPTLEDANDSLYSLGGTDFVSQVDRGRAVAAVFKISDDKTARSKSFSSRLKADVSGLRGHAAIQYLQKNLGKLNVIDIRIKGAGVELPSGYTNTEDFLIIINTLAKLIKESTGSARIATHLASYTTAFSTKNLFARQYQTIINAFKRLQADTISLKEKITASIEFYTAFDRSNDNWHKKDDPFFQALAAATANLSKYQLKLNEMLLDFNDLTTLSQLNIEKERAILQEIEQGFYKELDELPQKSCFTYLTTIDINFDSWEELKPRGFRRRVCEELFSLKLPPNTDHLRFSISECTYQDKSMLTPSTPLQQDATPTDLDATQPKQASPKTDIRLDLKRKSRGWHEVIRADIINGESITLWDLDKLNLENTDYLYLATSPEFNPHPVGGARKLAITIHAGNSKMYMETPCALYTAQRSAPPSPRLDLSYNPIKSGLPGTTITIPPVFATAGAERRQIVATPLIGHHHNSRPQLPMSADSLKPRATLSAPASLPASPARSLSRNSGNTAEASSRPHSSLEEIFPPTSTPTHAVRKLDTPVATRASASPSISPAMLKMLEASQQAERTLPTEPHNRFSPIAGPPKRSDQLPSAFTVPITQKARPQTAGAPIAPPDPTLIITPDERRRTPSL